MTFARYDYAATAGFAGTLHILRLMYLSVDAPRTHDDVPDNRYLRKPGATREHRLDDLNAVINHNPQGDR